MNENHQRAGRAAFTVAARALGSLDPEQLSAAEVVRLLDLGSRLERDGVVGESEIALDAEVPGDDPWARIARELTGG